MPYRYTTESETGSRFYIGYPNDLDWRITEHRNGEGHWTKEQGPWNACYYEAVNENTEARKRELHSVAYC